MCIICCHQATFASSPDIGSIAPRLPCRHAIVTSGTTLDNVLARVYHVHDASKNFVLAFEKFTLAWVNLILPFWSDMMAVGYRAWTALDLRIKAGIVLTGAVGYSLVAAYRRALRLKQKHEGAVRAMAFQASFLVAAPLLWFASPYVWFVSVDGWGVC